MENLLKNQAIENMHFGLSMLVTNIGDKMFGDSDVGDLISATSIRYWLQKTDVDDMLTNITACQNVMLVTATNIDKTSDYKPGHLCH